MLDQLEWYEIAILALLGIVILFGGYRVKKVGFFIIWFVLGFNLTRLFLPTINGAVPQIADNYWWQNLLPVGGGLLLALLGFTIEKVCVGGISFALVMVATIQYFGTELQTLAIGAVVGVIAAAVAVMLMKPAIIVATSAVGAYALTLVILWAFKEISYETFYWPILIGLTIVGSLAQFVSTKHIK